MKHYIRDFLEELTNKLKYAFIKSEVFNNSDGIEELVSLSIIGMDIHLRRIDQVMDIDTLIITRDPMNHIKYNEVKRIFENITDFSTDNISITFMIADGPIKPLPLKKYNIFFHVLLHTLRSYKESPLILVKNSWQFEARQLIGSPLSEVQSISTIKINEILNGKLGITHCIYLVEEKKSAYLKWIEENNSDRYHIELLPIVFQEYQEILEICYYSVLRAASNSLRYIFGHSWEIGIDRKDMKNFEDVFIEYDYSNFPIEIYEEKIKLRQAKWIPKQSDVSIRIESTLDFLNRLKKDLPKISKKNSPYLK